MTMAEISIYAYPGVDISVSPLIENTSSQLRQEYEGEQALFMSQTSQVQQFLENQAHLIADALVDQLPRVRFYLPDIITFQMPQAVADVLPVPNSMHRQQVNGRSNLLAHLNLEMSLRKRLSELERSSDRAVAISAQLIRYATSLYLVHTVLPTGHAVNDITDRGEDVPSIPANGLPQTRSTMKDAFSLTMQSEGDVQANRRDPDVPSTQAAELFYLPQWLAFNEQGNLLVNSIQEAEAHIASMQRFLKILQTAVTLAPYIVADETYQQKRYGMLGQFVNQGRLLASYQTKMIIQALQRRAASHQLNRGLSVSIPYLDDQELTFKELKLNIIPPGRILFVPAFVVLAVREEQARVSQNMRLSSSTRKHLLNELNALEQSFTTITDE
jgi:hypothetical protein